MQIIKKPLGRFENIEIVNENDIKSTKSITSILKYDLEKLMSKLQENVMKLLNLFFYYQLTTINVFFSRNLILSVVSNQILKEHLIHLMKM